MEEESENESTNQTENGDDTEASATQESGTSSGSITGQDATTATEEEGGGGNTATVKGNDGAVEPSSSSASSAQPSTKKKKSKKSKSKAKKLTAAKIATAKASVKHAATIDDKDEQTQALTSSHANTISTATAATAANEQQSLGPTLSSSSSDQQPSRLETNASAAPKKLPSQSNRATAEAILTKKAKRKPSSTTTASRITNDVEPVSTNGAKEPSPAATPAPPQQQNEEVVGTPVVRPGAYAMNRPAPVYVMGDESSSDDEAQNDATVGQQQQPSNASRTLLTSNVQMTSPSAALLQDDDSSDNKSDILEAQVALAKPTMVAEEDSPGSHCNNKKLWIFAAVMLLLLIVIIVIIVVVVTGGDDDNGAPATITLTPTLSPIDAATTPEPDPACYTSTRSIVDKLLSRNNLDDFVDIEICPGTNIDVFLSQRFDPSAGIEPAIPLQSNLKIKCGEQGRLRDACIIGSGNTLLLNMFAMSRELAAVNVVIEGITFQDGTESLLELTNGGDITFRNCLFRVSGVSWTSHLHIIFFLKSTGKVSHPHPFFRLQRSSSLTPIIVNFQGHESDPSIRQRVTFDSCLFEDITYGALPSNEYDVAAIIVATTPQNTVVLQRCSFRDVTVNGQVRICTFGIP
jgi:hypothetical protein